jgi:hypothetical protein
MNIRAQMLKCCYNDTIKQCEYTLFNGQLHGDYSSWYNNGAKKSEGKFYCNNRVGKWKVWDSCGNLRAERNYENNFVYNRIRPKNPKDKSIKLLNQFLPVPQRNESSYFEYFYVRERNEIYKQRYLCVILPENNPELFYSDDILQFLVKNRENNDFIIYRITNSYEKKKFEIESATNLKIIAFKTTMDFTYDIERQIMQPRIIMISPIILDTITNQIFDYNWFYSGDLFPHLVKITIHNQYKKLDILNISDVFFWNCYSYKIVDKIDFIKDAKLKDIKSTAYLDDEEMAMLLTNSEELLINAIETEHDYWIKYTKLPDKSKIK